MDWLYHSLLARDKILFSDILVASRIFIGLKGTFITSGKPCGDRKSIIALTYVLRAVVLLKGEASAEPLSKTTAI
jgi:hypothetical protein